MLRVVRSAAEPAAGVPRGAGEPELRAEFAALFRELRGGAEVRKATSRSSPGLRPLRAQQAFQIGFLVFLPFLVVDMVVANVLLALGMQSLSPSQVSLPFKVLLFVAVDGWALLARSLVQGYRDCAPRRC